MSFFTRTLFFSAWAITPWAIPVAASAEPTVTAKSAVEASHLVNYEKLDHILSVEHIRAGNQDEDGTNDYYLTFNLHGIANSSPNTKDPEPRSMSLSEEYLGATRMKALDHWNADRKAGRVIETEIRGDTVRSLISQAMKKFAADEADISVRVDVTLYEQNKRYYVLTDNKKIGQTSYDIVPAKGAFTQPFQDGQYQISDGKSTLVKLAVKYKQSNSSKPK